MPPRKTIQTATVSSEPVFIQSDGTQEKYIPGEIVTHRDAYAASLHLLFKHVADFHILMVDILAEKYNLDAYEIVKTVQNDERFQNMVTNPVISSLEYFTAKDLKKQVPTSTDAEVDELIGQIDALKLEMVPAPASEVAPAPPPQKKKVVVRKKKTEE